MNSSQRSLLALTTLLALSCTAAHAATFNIPNGDVAALKNAINIANSNNEDNVINLANNGVYTLTQIDNTNSDNNPTGLPVIYANGKNLRIEGGNATIQRSSQADRFRILQVGAGTGRININNVTLQGGIVPNGTSTQGGAGILNFGQLGLYRCVIQKNSADLTPGGGISNETGADIYLTECSLSGNRARYGGGLYNRNGGAGLSKCAVYNNSASSTNGGGVYNDSSASGPVTDAGSYGRLGVQLSTISGNTANNIGGGIYNTAVMSCYGNTITNNSANGRFSNGTPVGSGIASFSSVTYFGTTLALNASENIISGNSGVDVSYGANSVVSYGNNIVGSGDTSGVFNQMGDQRNISNVKLAPLADNGGPTKTHALLPGSPAIDAFTQFGSGYNSSFDQRGVIRPQGSAYDIGAFELAPSTINFGVSLTPYGPRTNQLLTATSNYNDYAVTTYTFRVNGNIVQEGSSNTLDLSKPGFGDRGDTVSVTASVIGVAGSTNYGRFGTATNSAVVADTPPSANNASGFVVSGRPIAIPLVTSDVDGDALTLQRIGRASNGTAELRLDTDGKYKMFYTSNPGFVGTDSVQFIARDNTGRSSNLATVTFNVSSASQAVQSSGSGASS